MEMVFRYTYITLPQKRPKLRKLLMVWQDLGLFPSHILASIFATLDDIDAPRVEGGPPPPVASTGGPADPRRHQVRSNLHLPKYEDNTYVMRCLSRPPTWGVRRRRCFKRPGHYGHPRPRRWHLAPEGDYTFAHCENIGINAHPRDSRPCSTMCGGVITPHPSPKQAHPTPHPGCG